MDSPKKASVKHIEFQLQREKALTKELNDKLKSLSAQNAQLEQDKAELRREKVQLAEEGKKSSRYEDRIHHLQKELDTKETIITQERTRAAEARAETEEVRFNANASIASWKQAEEQWIAEQTTLTESFTQQADKITDLQTKFDATRTELIEHQHTLQKERDRALRVDGSRDKLEADLRAMHEKAEKSQNEIYELKQKIYNLDLAGEKQKEAINLKDTEIKTLETRIAKHVATEERMEQSINSVNDRVNAAKMINLEVKSENEKLLCDIADACKENQHVAMQVASLTRELQLANQTHVSLQNSHDELRNKCHDQQEDLRKKVMEISAHELSVTELTVRLQQLESTTSDGSFQRTTLEAQIKQLKEEVKKLQVVGHELTEDRDSAREEVRTLKSTVDKKDEDLVMLQSQMEDRVESMQEEIRGWEQEVNQRQRIIQGLTDQVGNTNEKNSIYQGKYLEEYEVATKLRNEVDRFSRIIAAHQRNYLVAECAAARQALIAEFRAEENTLLFDGLEQQRTISCTCFTQTVQQEEMLFVQENQIQGLTDERERTESEFAAAQEQLAVLTRTLEALEAAVAEKEARRLSAAHKGATGQEEIAGLLQKITNLEQQLQAASDAHEGATAAAHAQLSSQISRAENRLRNTQECADIAEDWWTTKVQFVLTSLSAVGASRDSLMAAMITEKEQLERRNRELDALVGEAKNSSSRMGVALAEKQEAQLANITALEGQLRVTGKEKEHVSFQLTTLLARFEAEQKQMEKFKQEMQDLHKDERALRDTAEKQCAKLRSGIDYEIKRKCEYKSALEEVKRLRDESEKCRLKEKDLAGDAINRANEEASYWVRCFDKLKTMAETSRRNNTRVPSIDREMLTRLANAREQFDAGIPLKEQPTNTDHPSADSIGKLKRARVETHQ